MTFNNVNGVAQINGQNGIYDSKISDPNVKYGRNAVSNYSDYLANLRIPPNQTVLPDLKAIAEKLKDKTLPAKDRLELTAKTKEELEKYTAESAENLKKAAPLNFQLKYLPEATIVSGQINKLALLGASFEDLGKKISVPVSEMTANFQQILGPNVTAEAADINNDGQIDVAENAIAFLVKDMADKTPTDELLKTGKLDLNAANLDGTITNTGDVNFYSFMKTKDVAQNKQLFTQIADTFKLSDEQKVFLANANNTVQ